MTIESIRRDALGLSVEQRAALAADLLASLDAASEDEAEIEQLWLQEAARRADEVDRGVARLIPGDLVMREAQALLK